jgi:hypothetical protein
MKKAINLKLVGVGLLISACLTASAVAKVSEEEAARLGKDLTPMGGEMAGNAEGTIPAYTGGLAQTPDHVTGVRHDDPFKDDKILYSITSENMDQYVDNLIPGHQALLKKYPGNFRMDIYPTHRSHSAPQKVYDNTRINATRAELVSEGNGVDGAFGGIPFPIPASGAEAMWNHLYRWQGEADFLQFNAYVVNPDGGFIRVAGGDVWQKYPHYVGDSIEDFNGEVWNLFAQYLRPARRKGEVLLIRDAQNASEHPRKAWQYLVGQRRVRRAPTVDFDTPNAGFSGLAVYDDAFIFNGSLERYDWKLVGKQEVYYPYNSYIGDTLLEDPKEMYQAKFINPDMVRWELHRVFVVEATLKEGKRHQYAKRVFYIDEDSWVAALADSYDGRGTLWRTNLAMLKNMTELPGTIERLQVHYDLINGQYAVNNCQTEMEVITKFDDPKPPKYFTPEQIRRMGRR